MLKRLGGAIRRRRERAGISQDQLAETIHCSVERLDQFEKGLRDPYLDGVFDIANALNCRVSALCRDAKI
jgi:transcriptional regulator with XRE-family HTH domain